MNKSNSKKHSAGCCSWLTSLKERLAGLWKKSGSEKEEKEPEKEEE